MSKHSAGILVYHHHHNTIEVLLVHPGGPYWAKRDKGVWSIPKGEPNEGEELAATALREFQEETGYAPHGTPFALGQVKQPGGKVVHAWALEGDFDVQTLTSNTFTVESPRGSGQFREYPEVDRADWFDLDTARSKLTLGQVPLLDVLERRLG